MKPPHLTVCFVIEKLAGRSGGAERVMIELANWLAAKGIPVRILSYEHGNGIPFYPLSFGVTHCNMRRPNNSRSYLRRFFDRLREKVHDAPFFLFPVGKLFWLSRHGGFERALERDLDLHRPTVAVSFLPPAIVALGRVQCSELLRRVASVHNVPSLDLASPTRWDPNPLDVRRRMEAIAAHDEVTVLLEEFRDWFPPELRERVCVIPNPVPSVGSIPQQRERLVVSVGRLADVKRHSLLLDAWALIAGDFPDWRLEIYGSGPLRKELSGRIETLGLASSVSLEGHVKTINAVYTRAAILAHPAAYEGWGLAVTEALAHGVPAIGFQNCPGVNRLICHERNGLLASSRGELSRSLAVELCRLMSDAPLRRSLGAEAPASVQAFQPDRVRDLWMKALFVNHISTASAISNVTLVSGEPSDICFDDKVESV